MSDRNSEDIIGALYDMVQDARSMPLAADKCILERDKVLDMLDEIIAQLPAELKQSRTIVGDQDDGGAEGVPHHPHFLHHLLLQGHVQRGGRLVRKKNAGA